jgi:Fe-S cluster assembly scaffold protein SufB
MKTQIIRPEGDFEQNITLEPEQKMHLVIYCGNSKSNATFRFKLKQNTKLTVQYIVLGGNNSTKLLFEQDECSDLVFDGAFLLKDKEKLDFEYKTIQSGAKSKSQFNLVGCLDDKAYKNSSETIDFRRGADGAIGSECEKVTLFSNTAQNLAKPIILCDEENMHGTHNFSSGHLDPEAVSYLRTRGVDIERAKRIISREQIMSVAKLAKNEAIIKEIQEAIQ